MDEDAEAVVVVDVVIVEEKDIRFDLSNDEDRAYDVLVQCLECSRFEILPPPSPRKDIHLSVIDDKYSSASTGLSHVHCAIL